MRAHLFHARFVVSLALFALVLATIVGCGAGVGDVSGTVTYKGEPLKGGTVTLVNNESGPSFTGNINEDGTFVLTRVRGGNYKVCVDTESLKPAGSGSGAGTSPKMGSGSMPGKGGPPTGSGQGPPGTATGSDLQKKAESGKLSTGSGKIGDPSGGMYRDGFATMAENAAKYIKIPSKYAKPESTDLSFEAKRGPQTLTIELKD